MKRSNTEPCQSHSPLGFFYIIFIEHYQWALVIIWAPFIVLHLYLRIYKCFMIEICFDLFGPFFYHHRCRVVNRRKCLNLLILFFSREICVIETIILSISMLIMCVNAIWWFFFYRLQLQLPIFFDCTLNYHNNKAQIDYPKTIFFSLLLIFIGIHSSMIKNSIFININRKNCSDTLAHTNTTAHSVAAAKPNNIQKVSRYEFFTSYAHFYYSYYMQHYIFHLLCIHSGLICRNSQEQNFFP